MPKLPTGLKKRKSGTYYVRRRIPTDLLWAYPGKKELGTSLKTKKYNEAIELFYEYDGKLQAQWRKLRQRCADEQAERHIQTLEVLTLLADEDIDRISKHVELAALAGDEMRRLDGNYSIEEIQEYREGYSEVLPLLRDLVASGQTEELSPLLDQFLHLYGYENRLSAPDYRRLVLAYGRAVIRANEKLLRRYSGEDVPTPIVVKSTEGTQDEATLHQVIYEYIKKEYSGGEKEAMAKKVNLVLPMFAELVGNKSLKDIRQSDVNHFFDLVHKLWPHWAYEAKSSGKSWVDLAKSNNGKSRGEMAPGTFNDTYRAVISRFLLWAITNYQDRGFPTSLTVRLIEYKGSRQDKEHRQRAFSLSELKRLFEGSEMRALATNPMEHHKYWLVHVGLFTGARVNELCQLDPVRDVLKDETGLWFLKISDEGEDLDGVHRSVKTLGSRRLVPVHSTLVKLGFIDFVKKQRKVKAGLLFSPFKASKGRASGEAEKWFRKFLEKTGLRDETAGARIAGMHAFRSTFLNKAMNDGIGNAEVITGHSHRSNDAVKGGETKSSVVRGYEGEMSVESKSRILEKIAWPDLNFISPVGS